MISNVTYVHKRNVKTAVYRSLRQFDCIYCSVLRDRDHLSRMLLYNFLTIRSNRFESLTCLIDYAHHVCCPYKRQQLILFTMAALKYIAFSCIDGYEEVNSVESKKLKSRAAQALKKFGAKSSEMAHTSCFFFGFVNLHQFIDQWK